MSFWKKWFGNKDPKDAAKTEASDTQAGSKETSGAQSNPRPDLFRKEQVKDTQSSPKLEEKRALSPVQQLLRLEQTAQHASRTGETIDPRLPIRLLDSAVENHMAGDGIDAARRLTRLLPLMELRLRIAEHLRARGNREEAWKELEPLRSAVEAPLRGLLVSAELAESLDQLEDALRLYEQILARQIDYPQARGRAERLRARLHAEPIGSGQLGGATIAASGATSKGRYRIERELGRGGAGTVFLAQDERLGRRVALKIYHRRGLAEEQRLRNEAQTPASFEHPGIVRILDLDVAQGTIAMEHLSGSVRGEIDAGRVDAKRAKRWLQTAAEALIFVHNGGVVHKDIKPSNLLLRSDERAVLTDFGLATKLGEHPLVAGQGEGTLRYAPKEQLSGAAAHPSADVHAFGVTMLELCDVIDSQDNPVPSAWPELAQACTQENPAMRPSLPEVLSRL